VWGVTSIGAATGEPGTSTGSTGWACNAIETRLAQGFRGSGGDASPRVRLEFSPMVRALRYSSAAAEEVYRLIRDELRPRFAELGRLDSTPALLASPVYQSIEAAVRHVLDTPDVGSFAEREAPAKESYRIVGWNLERGIQYEGQLEAF